MWARTLGPRFGAQNGPLLSSSAFFSPVCQDEPRSPNQNLRLTPTGKQTKASSRIWHPLEAREVTLSFSFSFADWKWERKYLDASANKSGAEGKEEEGKTASLHLRITIHLGSGKISYKLQTLCTLINTKSSATFPRGRGHAGMVTSPLKEKLRHTLRKAVSYSQCSKFSSKERHWHLGKRQGTRSAQSHFASGPLRKSDLQKVKSEKKKRKESIIVVAGGLGCLVSSNMGEFIISSRESWHTLALLYTEINI